MLITGVMMILIWPPRKEKNIIEIYKGKKKSPLGGEKKKEKPSQRNFLNMMNKTLASCHTVGFVQLHVLECGYFAEDFIP